MAEARPFSPDDDSPIFVISVAATLAGMHAQTLRQYDRLGLVSPSRTRGGGRRYSGRDVAMLREVQRLSQEEGVSLAGIRRIIDLEQLAQDLRDRVSQLEAALLDAQERLAQLQSLTYPRGDLVPTRYAQSALVVWKPRHSPENG